MFIYTNNSFIYIDMHTTYVPSAAKYPLPPKDAYLANRISCAI